MTGVRQNIHTTKLRQKKEGTNHRTGWDTLPLLSAQSEAPRLESAVELEAVVEATAFSPLQDSGPGIHHIDYTQASRVASAAVLAVVAPAPVVAVAGYQYSYNTYSTLAVRH